MQTALLCATATQPGLLLGLHWLQKVLREAPLPGLALQEGCIPGQGVTEQAVNRDTKWPWHRAAAAVLHCEVRLACLAAQGGWVIYAKAAGRRWQAQQ